MKYKDKKGLIWKIIHEERREARSVDIVTLEDQHGRTKIVSRGSLYIYEKIDEDNQG